MKIYGFDVSNPTNKVRYVAKALGIEHTFEFVVPFSEQVQNDEYRELHPAEKVPSLTMMDLSFLKAVPSSDI